MILRGTEEAILLGHEVALLIGEPMPEGTALPSGVHLSVVEGLGYRAVDQIGMSAVELAQQVEMAARAAFGTLPDVWCLHNHSLGKNISYSALPDALARRGAALVLPIHDFAEDGRPENYAALECVLDKLYPCDGRIRYAVLNNRDRSVLMDAGLDPAHVAVVPNPVVAPQDATTSMPSPSSDLLLYPARGIRRKNLGEAVLLAVALEGRYRLAVTLPPESQVERLAYDAWVEFVNRRHICIELAAASTSGGELGALLRESRAVVTTSVKEGFGLAFLEPWLASRAVVGRDIPYVTSNFSQHGVMLDALYRSLPVPIEWAGGFDTVRNSVQNGLQEAFGKCGRTLPSDAVDAAMSSMTNTSGLVDFGRLTQSLQRNVVRCLQEEHDTTSFSHVLDMFEHLPGDDVIARNAVAIHVAYSSSAHTKMLMHLCEEAAKAEAASSFLNANRVLDAFLDPRTIFLSAAG